jgi:hypothetical protein
MADVAVVVGCDSADVHADLPVRSSRPKMLLLPRLGVVQVQLAGSLRSRAIRRGGGGGEGGGREGPGGVREQAIGARRGDQGYRPAELCASTGRRREEEREKASGTPRRRRHLWVVTAVRARASRRRVVDSSPSDLRSRGIRFL